MFFLIRFFGFIVWLLICILIGRCAGRWNRSFVKYFILSLLFSPLLIGIILLIMGKNKKVNNNSSSSSSSANYSLTGSFNSNSGPTWTCPKCNDKNPLSNSFCKGCGEYKPLCVGYGSGEGKNDTPIAHNTGDEWICKNCNEKNPLISSSCKYCGAYK